MAEKETILVVEGECHNRRILSDILKEKYTVVEAETGESAIAYLKQKGHFVDMVILDLCLLKIDGFQGMKTLRKEKLLHKVPVIVSSFGEKEGEEKALDLGAVDLLERPYCEKIVLQRVSNVLAGSRLRDLEREKQLVAKVEEMKRLVQRDGLTGLYNRMELEAKVVQHFAKGTDRRGAFVIVDVDNFKRINDSLGHLKGDEALRKVADILTSCFRQEDIVSRMGGDEFAVFIPNGISTCELEKRMNTLCRKMSFSIGGIQSSCSAGVCLAPEHGRDYRSLYQNADIALLSAKRFGKNQYQIFGNDMELPSLMLFRNMDWLLDEASDAIYVCDAQTHELYYLNNVACGMSKGERKDCVGKKCYEVLWGRTTPCIHCMDIHKMEAGFCEQQVNPEGTNVHYMIKGKCVDWNGKQARIQYIQDNTARVLESRMVQQELNHKQVLVQCIHELLGAEKIDDALRNMLNTLGNYYQGERAFILTGETKTGIISKTHQWQKYPNEVYPVITSFSIDAYPIWQKAFQDKKTVSIENVDALKTISPKEYEYLKKAGIRNSCTLCFDITEQYQGCIGVYNRKINQGDTELLESIGYFVKNELAKQIGMQQLAREKEKITSAFHAMQGDYVSVGKEAN